MILICGLLRLLSFIYSFVIITCLIVLVLVFIIQCVIINKQPHFNHNSSYKVPFVPFIPFASFIVNMYLMMTISLIIWLILFIWMVFGFAIYFIYGVQMSKENSRFKDLSKSSVEKILLNQNSNSDI